MQHLRDGADLSGSQSASSTASGTDMDDQLLSLTDDALLAVLAFVPTRDLFSLRVLCRRLRDLCLLPELWRWRNIGSWDKPAGTGLLRAALTLAPCLRGIHVGDEDDLEAVALYVSSTSCVIAGLGLSFTSSEEAFATTILQAVHSLGGLRMLDVSLSTSSKFHEIVYLIYSLRDLRQLNIFISYCGEPSFRSRPDLEVKPSLVQLCFYSNVCTEEGLEPFLPLFLEAHAATLEDVHLWDEVSFTLLKTLPKLRSVTFSEITVAALDFVRQSSQLRSVVFHSFEKLVIDALQALTESRSATVLEVFKFYLHGTMWDPHLMAVAACLPQFPLLRDLTLGGSYSDDFLRAVTPKSAPRLTTLSLKCDNECLHDWVHDIGIQDLLTRNHRLHLKVDFSGGEMVVCGCRSCHWGCHKDLRRHFLFSSHRRMADCPRDCYQVVVWPCSSSG